MSCLLQNTIFGNNKYRANTFIGGVASTLNTPELVAAKLRLPIARIKSFSIIGNDIQFMVIGTYSIASSTFASDSNITYFDDKNGLVTQLYPSAFGSTLNFRWCNFPKLLVLQGNGSGAGPFNHSGIINISLPECTTFSGGHHFDYCYSLKTVNVPKLTNMGSGGYYIFRDCTSLESIYAPVCTKIGATLNQDAIFQNIKTGCIINVHSSMATVNAGAPDGDLVSAVSFRKAIINYL